MTSQTIWKYARKCIASILILSTISLGSVYASALTDDYEYNDYLLYNSSGTYYSSGVFESDNNYMQSFTLAVDAVGNEWGISGGSTFVIPFPVGTQIAYHSTADRAAFLQNSYILDENNTRYNFSFIDDTGVFYCQGLPADPYYPVLRVYLYTENLTPAPPVMPTVSVTLGEDGYNYLTWNSNQNNHNFPAKIMYKEALGDTPTDIANAVYPPYKVEATGYYNIALIYSENGQQRYTDWSTTYAEYIEPEEEDDRTIIEIIDDYIDSLRDKTATIKEYIRDVGQIIDDLFDWLPSDIVTAFIAVVVIGLFIGLLL